MKDALRLLVYFVLVVLLGALLAPILFWSAQSAASRSLVPGLAGFDFETFFHRSLLLIALVLAWPLFRSLQVRERRDLGIAPDPRWMSHLVVGMAGAVVPLLCCGAILIATHLWSFRSNVPLQPLGRAALAAVFVPLIEEGFFRGLVLGILLRTTKMGLAILLTSALFSVLHFLKAPEHTSDLVTWASGFVSIAHAFDQFHDPMLIVAAFGTLFLIGWILADARVRTRSLWMPIGLHAGWILGNGLFSKMARRETLLLPWLGKNLLVGIIPLGVAAITWIMVRLWLKHERSRKD